MFEIRTYLDSHHKLHTGKQPFKYDQWDKKFWQKSDLVRHQRKHSGEILSKCDQCDKSFLAKVHYVIHQRIHSGEKPFE